MASGGIRFDRNEFAGALGDLGTDLPLLVGMSLAAGMDGASALTMFGLMQAATALVYRIPMPVQPLKAMAALVIAQRTGADVVYGAGLAIGAAMLVLSAAGAVDALARLVPKCVVRGIQFGLGLQLASLALGSYLPAAGAAGWLLAAAAFALAVLLMGDRRYPAALFIVALGLVYAFAVELDALPLLRSAGFQLPRPHLPSWSDVATGFVVLALPQLPLSLGNSVLAMKQVAEDLFPERPLTVRRIGLTYAAMNLVNPFFGGVPTCHGSGGMAGHYAFGARTGGSVLIEGAFYILLGLFFGAGYDRVTKAFPLPVLGVLLLFEGLAMMRLIKDTTATREFPIVLLVGLAAVGLPYGYVIGLVLGTILARSGAFPD